MKRVLLTLLVAAAGCSYPHLVADRKIDERYIERIEDSVARVTSLAFEKPVPHSVLTVEQAREHFAKDWDEELAPDTSSTLAAMRAFGFVQGPLDLRSVEVDIQAEEAAAFYDPRTKEFYILDKDYGFGIRFASWATNRDLANEMSAAHELVHAIQDQAYDLEKYLHAAKENDDATLARVAIVEGEATYFGLIAMGLKPGDIQIDREDLIEGGGDSMEKAPPLLRELLVFPYWAGHTFTRIRLDRKGTAAAFGRVDPWAFPPDSTAQILHPELWEKGKAPPSLHLADLPLPSGWHLARENVLGAFMAGVLTGGADTPGWLADRYRVLEDTTGRLALGWSLFFDTHANAHAFAEGYRRFQRTKGVKEACVEVTGSWVTVAEAPDEETFRSLREVAALASVAP